MGEANGSSTPDPALVALFTRLLDAYQASLVAFAFGVVGERELARDIVQETFVAAWQAALRQAPPFRALCDADEKQTEDPPSDSMVDARRWLFAVTYRQAALTLRRQRRFVWQSLDHDGSDEVVGETPDLAQRVAEVDALRRALSALSTIDAACFLLQVVHGLSTEEIAVVVKVRPSAVRKRLSRARQRLRVAYATSLLTASNTSEISDGGSSHA